MSKLFAEHLDNLKKADYSLKKLHEAICIVSHDAKTVSPSGSAAQRSELIAFLAEKRMEILQSPYVAESLNFLLENSNQLKEDDRIIVTAVNNEMKKVAAIPKDLYSRNMLLKFESENMWKKAKDANNYNVVKEIFKQLVKCTNEVIDCLGYKENRYDALLNQNDPGLTVRKLDEIFSKIKKAVIPLVNKVNASRTYIDDSFIRGYFDISTQKLFAQHLLQSIGFNLDDGMQIESEHPYTCGINSTDVRLTNHFYADKLMPGIFMTLHEGGHGIYEQNVSPKLINSVAGGGQGGCVHESSSRFWENIIGRSRSFWIRETPFIKSFYPIQFKGRSSEDIYRAFNKVSNNPLRLYADELMYNLHIIFRYEMEKDLFNGNITVDDLNDVWNEKMKQYLGIVPTDITKGLLQDVHWFQGLFGYFHSYTLGNINSAQIAHTLRKKYPDFDKIIEEGRTDVFIAFLREHWYQYGKLYKWEELMFKINGEEIDARYLCDYLVAKYTDVYEL